MSITKETHLPNTSISFLEQTFESLGMKEEHNIFYGPEVYAGEIVNEDAKKYQLFSADKDGNLIIHYYDLKYGYPYRYRKANNKWEQHYTRTRLRKPFKEAHTGQEIRYLSPKGAPMFPFFYSRYTS